MAKSTPSIVVDLLTGPKYMTDVLEILAKHLPILPPGMWDITSLGVLAMPTQNGRPYSKKSHARDVEEVIDFLNKNPKAVLAIGDEEKDQLFDAYGFVLLSQKPKLLTRERSYFYDTKGAKTILPNWQL